MKAAELRSGKENSEEENVKRFLSSVPSEMLIIDCVAVAGSKALSVKTPSTPVSTELTAGILESVGEE